MNDSWDFLTETDPNKFVNNPIAQDYIKQVQKEEWNNKSKTWQKMFSRLSKNNKILVKLNK